MTVGQRWKSIIAALRKARWWRMPANDDRSEYPLFEKSRQIGMRLPNTREIVEVDVAISNDGLFLFEGDIVLGRETMLEGFGISTPGMLWPGAQIPFRIESGDQAVIDAAIAEWHVKTPIRLVPFNSAVHTHFIIFRQSAGESLSEVGRQPQTPQVILLASGGSAGVAMHEIGHAAGLWHEHTRPLRDQSITVHMNNIELSARKYFKIRKDDGSTFGQPYDYGSIMHYASNAYSANGLPTIAPTQASAVIGQRDHLSAGDITTIQAMYP
ncbi:MAG: M12 family metallopeptidase [Acidobacteriota bacterium]